MKRFGIIAPLLAFAFVFAQGSLHSQTKVGYVDSKKIVDVMPETRDAKLKLDALVGQWQTDLTLLQDSLTNLKDDYQKKKLILTDQLKTQFEENIKTLEGTINSFKTQKFGENGEYFQKQIEFMKPVQDRVFAAIDKVAKQEDFDYIIDRSSDIILLYANERYDITTKVINTIEGK